MLKLLLFLFVMVSGCVVVHGAGMVAGMRWLSRAAPRHGETLTRWRMFHLLTRVVYGLLVLHILQILLWAACYEWVGIFPDFETSFYYSATSYATVGYGDVIPPEEWRILGAVQGVTGILMFGWSTGALFSVANYVIKVFSGMPRDDG